MTKNGRRRTTTVATALLAGSAAAAVATRARRERRRPRAVLPVLELTPSHRGGSGTPLLLLHGIGAIWRVWSPVLPHLEPHHDVIAPTLPGHGGGRPLDPQIAPSIQALTDGIEDELDRLGLQQVHIAGNSLGGRIGIELARRGRARSLVLFSPPGAWRSQRSIELRATGYGSLSALSVATRRAPTPSPPMACCAGPYWPGRSLTPIASHPRRWPPPSGPGDSPRWWRHCFGNSRFSRCNPCRLFGTTPSGWSGPARTGCCRSTVSAHRCWNGYPGRS